MEANQPPESHLHLRPHVEEHFTAGDVVRDVVIGMSDGLTVPFALAAGISGAVASSHLVVTEGLAILTAYGVDEGAGVAVVEALKRQPSRWVDFMMRFELGLERPNPRRALGSATTIGGAYVAGGLFPLLPYMLVGEAARALPLSVALTLVALLVFGIIKGRFTGAPAVRSAAQTVVIGGI